MVFYKHDLAFVRFSFFHPLHVGEQSVEYPQGVISIQRTKAAASKQRRLLDTTSIHLCCAPFPLVLWVPVLSS